MAPDTIPIPEALFDDPGYRVVTPLVRIFLIDLYRRFGDCERFTVDYKTGPKQMTQLVKSGLVKVCGHVPKEVGRGAPRCVYEFRYSVASAYD